MVWPLLEYAALLQCGKILTKQNLDCNSGEGFFKDRHWGMFVSWSASYEDLLLQFNLPTLFSLFGLTWLYILPPWTLDWEAMILHILLAWCLVPQLIIHCFSPMLFKCGMTSLPLELRHYQFSRKRSSTTGTLMTVNYNYYLYILVLAGMLLIRPCI